MSNGPDYTNPGRLGFTQQVTRKAPTSPGLLAGFNPISAGINLLGGFALSKYQYSKDLEMWNRSNQYNLPINQMKRLKDAGINPNMAYMKGTLNNVASQQLPKYQAPQMKQHTIMPDMTTMLGAYQDFKLKQAQIDNVGEQTRSNKIDNNLKQLHSMEYIDSLLGKWRSDKYKGRSARFDWMTKRQNFELSKYGIDPSAKEHTLYRSLFHNVPGKLSTFIQLMEGINSALDTTSKGVGLFGKGADAVKKGVDARAYYRNR